MQDLKRYVAGSTIIYCGKCRSLSNGWYAADSVDARFAAQDTRIAELEALVIKQRKAIREMDIDMASIRGCYSFLGWDEHTTQLIKEAEE